MNIQIISTCQYKISEKEFVDPLVRLAKDYGSVFVTNYKGSINTAVDKTIISGTAIKDFDYLDMFPINVLGRLGKVLGICAGAQLIAKYFKVPLIEREIIGKHRLSNGEYGFFLITKIPDPKTLERGFDVLLYMDDTPVMVKKNNFYLSLFHPEVLNQKILQDFLFDDI